LYKLRGGQVAEFPADAPKERVMKVFAVLGFRIEQEKEHISMARVNPDGTTTPLTIPNYLRLKGSTLRTICTQAGVSRGEFLAAYDQS
jgi:hypothetical protein